MTIQDELNRAAMPIIEKHWDGNEKLQQLISKIENLPNEERRRTSSFEVSKIRRFGDCGVVIKHEYGHGNIATFKMNLVPPNGSYEIKAEHNWQSGTIAGDLTYDKKVTGATSAVNCVYEWISKVGIMRDTDYLPQILETTALPQKPSLAYRRS